MVKTPRSFAILAFAVLAGVLLAGSGVFSVERINQHREVQALSDARQLGLAALQYAQDNKEHYPDADHWEQELKPYLDPQASDVFHPLAPIGGTPRQFSLNPALSGKSMVKVSDPTNSWLFYESVSPKKSASDNLDYFPDAEKDGGHNSAVVYGDGHIYEQGKQWKSMCQGRAINYCGAGMPN